MNSLHLTTELMYFCLCIVFCAIVMETRLFDNPYFEYGLPIAIVVTTLSLWRFRYNKIMKEMKKQKKKED